MRIKKFIAKSMQEALQQVKKEFGDDAIILNSKKIKDEAHPEWKNAVEVTAAIDKQLKEDNEVGSSIVRQSDKPIKQDFRQKLTALKSQTNTAPKPVPNLQLNMIQKDLSLLGSQIDLLVNHIKYQNLPHFPKPLQERVKLLVKNGIEPTIANQIAEELFLNMRGEDFLKTDQLDQKILYKLKNLLKVSGPIKFHRNFPTVIPVVGPTGVGKTTIVAKLAAQYKYTHQKRVVIVSSDSYRIAAMEQLKAFADITKIPFLDIYSNQDIPERFVKLRDFDLIIIDTAGINAKDMKKMIQLKELIRVSRADHILLTLSLTTRTQDLKDAIKNFSIIPNTSLVFTKLDETSYFGDLLNLTSEFDTAVSYLSMGQNIPEDLVLADRLDMAGMILRGKMR
jgi:flagellar biosynthesis protein FlhF